MKEPMSDIVTECMANPEAANERTAPLCAIAAGLFAIAGANRCAAWEFGKGGAATPMGELADTDELQ